jgi:FdhD protein
VKGNIITVPIRKVDPVSTSAEQDLVAVEEPLQIRLGDRDFAITMRTPGQDRELAAGFLFTEGVIQNPKQIRSITSDDLGSVTVELAPGVEIDFAARNFYVTSSCGICGKASIDGLKAARCSSPPHRVPKVDAAVIPQLPDKLRQSQPVFSHTGGLHGAGLFNAAGDLLAVREDEGRHNAVDKLIGAMILQSKTPLHENILMLSGRISFELVQKALMAGIPIVAAVGAPSSLAIETALHFGMTLIGFLRGPRYNVYSGADRLL